MMKRFGKFTIALLLAMTMVFTVSGTVLAGDTIKIGVCAPITGDVAAYGIPCTYAVKDYADKVNAKGGVLGKKIEVLVEDDVCKPEVATNVATKLVSNGVDFIIGHLCSGCCKAAMNIYKEAKVIAISGAATNDSLTLSGDYPNFYRTIAYDSLQAQLQVKFATEFLGAKTVAILHDKQDYGKGQAELAKGFFEKQGTVKVVLFEGVTPGAVDFSAIVSKIKRAKVDAVIWGGYHPEATKIVMQMRKKRMKTVFMGGDGSKDDTFIKVAGKYADGIYATGPKDTSDNPMMVQISKAYKDKYKSELGIFYPATYSAMIALVNAIEKAGSTDYEAVKKALISQLVETPLGKISFDEKGDAMGVGFSVYQVKNDTWTEL